MEEKVAAEEAAKKAAAPKPRGVPPVAAPTPSSRQAAQKTGKEPKLVATLKIESFCRATRRDVKEYLLLLEEQGVTQESLDNAGQAGRREAPRSVYDRKFAVRS
jgi:hypothetical protein